ncbi:MAG: fabD [Acidimicrobiales bacterium]|nr:fabD [Acidimicrobiales bacterium]
MSIAVVFPGQGSQQAGAGRPWVDHPAWAVVERAEAALDLPLAPLLLDAPAEQLQSTREAQLAVLLTSLVAWEALRPSLDDVVGFAGHSLGQVTALIAAEAVDVEAGLRFAVARADATQAAADARPGRMAALLGADPEQAAAACAAAPDGCWIANVNAPGQIVIAGTRDGVMAGSERAAELGVRRVRALDVGGAFHTPLMEGAVDALRPVLEATTFQPVTTPIVTNHDGLAHTDPEGWPERLAVHLVSPVRWVDCVEALAAAGATTFVEVGAGGTLSALIRRIVPEAELRSVQTPADLPAAVAS